MAPETNSVEPYAVRVYATLYNDEHLDNTAVHSRLANTEILRITRAFWGLVFLLRCLDYIRSNTPIVVDIVVYVKEDRDMVVLALC